MIIKDKSLKKVSSVTAKAGQRQEQDVAFYLRRDFKEHKQIFVFNDLKFSHHDEIAQIDHLILYPYGFILIESKSITGEVKVNKYEEWTRSYNRKWQGMPSPIKQVELQQNLLKDLLREHRADIIGRILLIKQQGFGMRCWNNLCAVSSNAIINRESMPISISQQLVKSEFLVDKLKDIMKLRNKVINTINFLDSRPKFNQDEMKSISEFLLAQDISTPSSEKNQTTPIIKETDDKLRLIKEPLVTPAPVPHTPEQTQDQIKALQLICTKCGATDQLIPSHGKYGYYAKCECCAGNTAMKRPCPSCKSKNTKVSKKRELYSLNCQDCQQQTSLEILVTEKAP